MDQERARDLPAGPPGDGLFGDVASLIEGALGRVAVTVNAELTMLYWGIGRRIRQDVLEGARGEYGQRIVQRLADRLTARYGRGYSRQTLLRMIGFAETYPSGEIVSTLLRQLRWSHFLQLVALSDADERRFYDALAARCITEPLRDAMQRRIAAAVGHLGPSNSV